MHRDEGQRLLLEVARNPSRELARAFDAYFYPIVNRYVLRRRLQLARLGGFALPDVGAPLERLEETAHVTAVTACHRARANAGQFDPALGTAEAWVLRNAAYAYRETVSNLDGHRRKLRVVPTDGEALERAVDERRAAPDTFDIVSARERLQAAFAVLEPDEQAVVILCQRDGHSYEEAAEMLFHDAAARKKVDRLLQSATLKLKTVASNYSDKEAPRASEAD